MKVFERIGRMLRADAHGMMDQLEERSLVLKQHLREAELEVAHKRASLETLDEERQRVKEEGQQLEAQVAALDEDVELAMAGGHPDLARFAIRRLLPKREALAERFARAARLDEQRARLFEVHEAQESQLAELQTRVRAALARPEADKDPFGVYSIACEVTEEEVDLELLRRRSLGDDATSSSLGEDAR